LIAVVVVVVVDDRVEEVQKSCGSRSPSPDLACRLIHPTDSPEGLEGDGFLSQPGRKPKDRIRRRDVLLRDHRSRGRHKATILW